MGLGDKLGSITSRFRRKSLDQKIDEILGQQSSVRESTEFSDTFTQLNKNAAERFRAEVGGVGKALFTRAEERFDSNYPAVEKAPFGDMTQESPLTRNFDKFPLGNDFQSGFERMESTREESNMDDNPFLRAATAPPSLPEENTQPSFRQDMSSYPRPEAGLGERTAPMFSSQHFSPSTSTTQSDISAILKELQAIREQNAVILEKLKRIEERLK